MTKSKLLSIHAFSSGIPNQLKEILKLRGLVDGFKDRLIEIPTDETRLLNPGTKENAMLKSNLLELLQ